MTRISSGARVQQGRTALLSKDFSHRRWQGLSPLPPDGYVPEVELADQAAAQEGPAMSERILAAVDDSQIAERGLAAAEELAALSRGTRRSTM